MSRIALALAAFGVAPAALAQDTAGAGQGAAGTGQTPADPTTITVTGSRVVRDGFEAPTPVTVLGIEEMQKNAPAHIADAINELPQFWGSSTPQGQLAISGINNGGNSLNLRGMGANRTLVLLNGRRVAPSATTGTTDINLFPAALVSRVDVVTGGASAGWGSDAVSGVVNFNLDTRFTGFKGSFDVGLTDRHDGGNRKAELSYGTPFAGDRGHVVLSGLYSEVEQIPNTGSRNWYNSTKLIANPDWAAGNDQPYWIRASNVGTGSFTAGGLITSVTGGAPASLRGTTFNPDGTTGRFTFGRAIGQELQIGGTFVDPGGAKVLLQPSDTQKQMFGHVSFDFTDAVTGFVEVSWADSRTTGATLPTLQAAGASTPAVVIRADNPYLPLSIRSQMPAGSTFLLGRENSEPGLLNANVNQRQMQRYVAGIDAEIVGDWTANAYVQFGRSEVTGTVARNVIPANLVLAQDAVTVTAANVGTSGLPIGSIACRSTLASPTNGCVPFNPFGSGAPSQTAMNYATGTSLQTITLEQTVAAVDANGTLFSTWAGPVAAAFGAEWREENVVGTADANSIANRFRIGNPKPIAGNISVIEGFAEVAVPLLADVPFIRHFDVDAAVRYTHYELSGSVTSWKLGANWVVDDDLRFRVTRSHDIRAPNVQELFASPTTMNATVFDPQTGANMSLTNFTQGNLNLKPEISDQWGVGVIFRPSWIPGFTTSIDYYDIKITDAIATVRGANAVEFCFQGFTAFCESVNRSPTGELLSVLSQPINENTIIQRGLDFEFSYRPDFADIGLPGNANFRALFTHIMERKTISRGVVDDVLGETYFRGGPPRWRGRVSADYNLGVSRTSVSVNYVSKGVIDRDFIEGGNTALLSIDDNSIAAFTSVDVSETIDLESLIGQDVQFTFAVRNLFDANPPVAVFSGNPSNFPGVNPEGYDVIGRQYRLALRFKF